MATSLGYQISRNPIAQSFFVDEPTGVYLTKIELYFKTAGADPVCLQIRPMVNGVPSTTEIVPQSIVYVNGSNINIAPAGVGIPVKNSFLSTSAFFDFSCITLKSANLRQENIIKIKLPKHIEMIFKKPPNKIKKES